MKAVAAGLAAGIAGTITETLWTRAQRKLLGRIPVYDTTRMAGRLLERVGGDAAGLERLLATAMRISYGPSWGVAAAVLAPRVRPAAGGAVALAAVIWVFELCALPLSGATPPLREWPRGEVALDASNALVFSLVASVVLRTVLKESG